MDTTGTAPHDVLLTPAEAAERLRVSADALYRWRRKNVGPRWTRVGDGLGRIRYPAAELTQYLQEQAAAA
ncbi:AlpA family transcriptional regulator [Pseudonocardia sp. ICBG601]|uniref:helix-turn-helix transcriptional regulator n=1 Tax=Pseudonocardia sp. ICBG601 TaxID=2846759 RepID=UPI001CF60CA7|nr:helix-turn-helix domain-containing protein [Pseudonocardia sp. ICBG601]